MIEYHDSDKVGTLVLTYYSFKGRDIGLAVMVTLVALSLATMDIGECEKRTCLL